jgi:hypothetical protein
MNNRRVFAPSSRRFDSGERGPVQRWSRFLAGMLAILLFAFGVIPGLERLEPVREVRDVIRRADIDASALFYTESDVSSEAEGSIRNAMKYSDHCADRSTDP